MKESNETPFLNCDDIEQLLIKRNIDGLSEEESQMLQEHLRSCDRCRSFENTLLSLQDSMQFGTREKLAPDPAIRENVIQRMRDLKPQETRVLGKAYKAIKSLLQYRIPVYQALPVVILILLLSLAVEQFPSSTRHEPAGLSSIAKTESPVPAQLRVIEDLGIIDQQKIGQSLKEDTTLAQFIVGTI
jgi:anti-sigma factor RsiW